MNTVTRVQILEKNVYYSHGANNLGKGKNPTIFPAAMVKYWANLGLIGLMCTLFANGPGDKGSIPGRVIPKTQKMVPDAALLNTQGIWMFKELISMSKIGLLLVAYTPGLAGGKLF